MPMRMRVIWFCDLLKYSYSFHFSKVGFIFSDEKRHGESDERTKLPKSQTALRWYGKKIIIFDISLYHFFSIILVLEFCSTKFHL